MKMDGELWALLFWGAAGDKKWKRGLGLLSRVGALQLDQGRERTKVCETSTLDWKSADNVLKMDGQCYISLL
jgi:hypothetical protein